MRAFPCCPDDPSLSEAHFRVLIHWSDRVLPKACFVPRISLAVVLADQQRYAETLEMCRVVVSMTPEDPRGWAGLAGAQYFIGNHAVALAACRQCESMIGRNPDVAVDGWNLTHNVAQATYCLERATQAAPALSEDRRLQLNDQKTADRQPAGCCQWFGWLAAARLRSSLAAKPLAFVQR